MFGLIKLEPEKLTESILKRCASVSEAISLEVPDQDIEGMVGKLNQLTSLTGTMSECVADSLRLYRHCQSKSMEVHGSKGLQPSVLNKIVDADCGDQEALKTYCERLKSAMTATMDGIVTIVSLYKTELQANKEHTVYKKR